MEESRELKKLYGFLQSAVYGIVLIDVLLHSPDLFSFSSELSYISTFLYRIPFLSDVLVIKGFTIVLVTTVSLGSKPKKSLHFNPYRLVVLPLSCGMGLLGYALFLNSLSPMQQIIYATASLVGVICMHMGMDNIKKWTRHKLLEDPFNTDNESFLQNEVKRSNPYSVNLPMTYYYKGKTRKGWVNIENPFRGTLVMGTPGSGKTYSIIEPYIDQLIGKGFSALIYDFKYPDLTNAAYTAFKKAQRKGAQRKTRFEVVNLMDPSSSIRINPLHPRYIQNLADAIETADVLVHALKKSDVSGGSDQFFTQSAINMLAAVIYFLATYENGKYSSLPHVLAFLQQDYETMFLVLQRNAEIQSLLSPFISALKTKAVDQLEGQLGTLRINISHLATKESFWVFSENDISLRLNDPENPVILVLASSPRQVGIIGACYAVLLNRIIQSVNSSGGNACALIVDEAPTIYLHRIENLIATARSNKVAVLLGIQDIAQLRQQYGRQATDTICGVMGNVISGQLRNKESLEWLERLFGRNKQIKKGVSVDRNRLSENLSEQLDQLVPAAKIASLQPGELVGKLSSSEVFFATIIRKQANGKLSVNYQPKINVIDIGQNMKEVLHQVIQINITK